MQFQVDRWRSLNFTARNLRGRSLRVPIGKWKLFLRLHCTTVQCSVKNNFATHVYANSLRLSDVMHAHSHLLEMKRIVPICILSQHGLFKLWLARRTTRIAVLQQCWNKSRVEFRGLDGHLCLLSIDTEWNVPFFLMQNRNFVAFPLRNLIDWR